MAPTEPETGALTRAGYAYGEFDYDNRPATQHLHTYVVRCYDLRRPDGRAEWMISVVAETAEHAIHIVSETRQFRFTRNNQNSADPAERDNAHYQRDRRTGYVGFAAKRDTNARIVGT